MGYDQVLRSGAFLRMFRTVPISLCLLGAGALHAGRTDASSLAGLQGSWYVCAESQAIFRIDLTKEEAWSASLLAPSEYLTDGEDFWQVSGPAVSRRSLWIEEQEGTLAIAFEDPGDPDTPDIIELSPVDQTKGEFSFKLLPFEPFTMLRAPSEGKCAFEDWDSNARYSHLRFRPSNREIASIFDEDQRERSDAASLDDQGLHLLALRDRERRNRAKSLLREGQLKSGRDFYFAAFIFQHGEEPSDYLQAHALAMVALARGEPSARWIAAASLDRFLLATNQPQIFGTQFQVEDKKPSLRLPYDPDVISPHVLEALGVQKSH